MPPLLLGFVLRRLGSHHQLPLGFLDFLLRIVRHIHSLAWKNTIRG